MLFVCLLQGNNREILHKFSVDLPKKHGRGGQSAVRFARLRMEKRHNYVRKVRLATTHGQTEWPRRGAPRRFVGSPREPCEARLTRSYSCFWCVPLLLFWRKRWRSWRCSTSSTTTAPTWVGW